jgi:hypothetical protein
MIFFFLFVYKILFAIGIFFAIDSVILSMYLCWIGMIILFGSLLQVNKTNFNVTPITSLYIERKPVLPSVSNPMAGGSDEIVHV